MPLATDTRTADAPALSVQAWGRLLRGYAGATRTLNAQLLRDHGLTINDYEALLLLGSAQNGFLRRTDLARDLELTASGVTRLLDGLEAAGFVEKGTCPTDGRVSYAVLTDAGRAKLEQASCSHVAAIDELFESYSREELETLAELLGRFPGSNRSRCPLAD